MRGTDGGPRVPLFLGFQDLMQSLSSDVGEVAHSPVLADQDGWYPCTFPSSARGKECTNGWDPLNRFLNLESCSVLADIVDSCFRVISGMLSYCDRYSEGMQHVLKTFGPIPDFSGATVEKVNQVCRLLIESCAGRAMGEVLFVASLCLWFWWFLHPNFACPLSYQGQRRP